MNEERIKLEDLKPGPIRRTTLPPELLSRVETLRSVLADVCPISGEQWRDNLQRDLNPEQEVLWWERLAGCFTGFVARRDYSTDQRQAAFKVIFGLFIGFGEQDLAADLEKLSESDVNELATTINLLVKTDSKR
jgi:hypothetical protein